ncbi:hypothetical protein BX070DRAFT_217921 [Coemansia spiralis]|nr:hypothetical protein BX070DRAFT_217921 [Coemansia spiralis]
MSDHIIAAKADEPSRQLGSAENENENKQQKNPLAQKGGVEPTTTTSSARSSFHSKSNPLFRLSSIKTHTTNSSSKNTAFYSAQSQITPSQSTNSFHTAMATASEDEELVHAMARQYVLDAEMAGSASPSRRSRRDTDASRMVTERSLGGDITTSSSDYPQMPPLRHMGRDNESSHGYESSVEKGRALEQLRNEEVEDDANEARLFVPVRKRYPMPRYSVNINRSVPAGAVLFVCGFILLPLWWIGAVFPRTRDSDVVRTWRKYNMLMTLLSLPLLGLFLALGGWQATHN